jgi:hypothetical protein
LTVMRAGRNQLPLQVTALFIGTGMAQHCAAVHALTDGRGSRPGDFNRPMADRNATGMTEFA